jgi:hypothetical protein
MDIIMTPSNIQDIFLYVRNFCRNERDLVDFLKEKNKSLEPSTCEYIYNEIVELIHQHAYNDDAKKLLKKKYENHDNLYGYQFFDLTINCIIIDFNDYYMVDRFYAGYWYDCECYADESLQYMII